VDDVVEQQVTANIHIAAMLAQHRGNADAADRARYHLGGRLRVVADFGIIVRPGPKQQLVGIQCAMTIENRLAAQIDKGRLRRRCSLGGLC